VVQLQQRRPQLVLLATLQHHQQQQQAQELCQGVVWVTVCRLWVMLQRKWCAPLRRRQMCSSC
jgi:hypothetical protein